MTPADSRPSDDRPADYRPVRIGALTTPGNLFLAPVAGYTDRAFRRICVEHGADFTYTELVSSEALVRGGVKTHALLDRADNEERYGVQIFGADPEVMYRAALLLAPWRPDLVDINAGCPVTKVVKTGAGAALTRNPALLARVVEAVVRASQQALGGVPVTVKIRSGWDAGSLNDDVCARAAREAGAALVTLHPRTRSQGYGGRSDWSRIAALTALMGPAFPVAGSGDLFTPDDAARMLRETGCAAVMFARGALGNPMIFHQTRDLLTRGTWAPASLSTRLDAAFRQLDLRAADVGEAAACREMRKVFCAYTRGAPGGSRLRDRIVRADSVAAYRAIGETAGWAGGGGAPGGAGGPAVRETLLST